MGWQPGSRLLQVEFFYVIIPSAGLQSEACPQWRTTREGTRRVWVTRRNHQQQ